MSEIVLLIFLNAKLSKRKNIDQIKPSIRTKTLNYLLNVTTISREIFRKCWIKYGRLKK